MKSKLALFLFLFAAPLVLAQCPYLDVSLVESAQAQAGVKAIYPITLTNAGTNPQLVSLAASCEYPLECSDRYLDVSLVESAQAQAGVKAIYPITLTNAGTNPQLVSLAASCEYPLECSFSQAPYSTLSPTQSALFQLEAKSEIAGAFQIPLSISAGTNYNCDSKTLSLTVSQAPAQENDPFELFFTPTANQSGRPGDEISYSLRIANNRNSKIYVRLASEG